MLHMSASVVRTYQRMCYMSVSFDRTHGGCFTCLLRLLGMLLQTTHPGPPTDPDQLEAQYKSVSVCATITCVRLGEANKVSKY